MKVNILLVKSESCPHCVSFKPIYEKAKELFEEKEYKINFHIYDTQSGLVEHENNDKDFLKSVLDLIENIQGVPTVLGSINNDKRSIKEINRTPQETEDLEELGNNFLKDISNYYKNHLSETKDLHLQVAGNNL